MIPSVYLALLLYAPQMRPWALPWLRRSWYRPRVRVWQTPAAAPLRWPA